MRVLQPVPLPQHRLAFGQPLAVHTLIQLVWQGDAGISSHFYCPQLLGCRTAEADKGQCQILQSTRQKKVLGYTLGWVRTQTRCVGQRWDPEPSRGQQLPAELIRSPAGPNSTGLPGMAALLRCMATNAGKD